MKKNNAIEEQTVADQVKQEHGLVFTVSKMFVLPDAGMLKGFADVLVNDTLIIKGVRIVEGKKGLMVQMPREQGKDSKWYDQVAVRNENVFSALADAVLQEYNSTT